MGSKEATVPSASADLPMFAGLKLPDPPEFSGHYRVDALDASTWLTLMKHHLSLRDINLTSAKSVQFTALF
jgi:hypothetical protein